MPDMKIFAAKCNGAQASLVRCSGTRFGGGPNRANDGSFG